LPETQTLSSLLLPAASHPILHEIKGVPILALLVITTHATPHNAFSFHD
jgi:hypothetical protein